MRRIILILASLLFAGSVIAASNDTPLCPAGYYICCLKDAKLPSCDKSDIFTHQVKSEEADCDAQGPDWRYTDSTGKQYYVKQCPPLKQGGCLAVDNYPYCFSGTPAVHPED